MEIGFKNVRDIPNLVLEQTLKTYSVCFNHMNTSSKFVENQIRNISDILESDLHLPPQAFAATKHKIRGGWKETNRANPLWSLLFNFILRIIDWEKFPNIKRIIEETIAQINS